jgi:hypothetical protein
MRLSSAVVRILSAVMTAALIASCSGQAPGPGRPADGQLSSGFRQQSMGFHVSDLLAPRFRALFEEKRAMSAGPIRSVVNSGGARYNGNCCLLVYASDYNTGTVTGFYPEGFSPCQINGLRGPIGMHEDATGDLYVAVAASGVVLEFSPRCGVPPIQIFHGTAGCTPTDVTIDPAAGANFGKVYVANDCTGGVANIVNYTPPCPPPAGCNANAGSLSDPKAVNNSWIAFDANGDLFASVLLADNTGQVDCYAAAAGAANEILSPPAPPMGFPGGVNARNDGLEIAVADQDGVNNGLGPGIKTFGTGRKNRCAAGTYHFVRMIAQPSKSQYIDISVSTVENNGGEVGTLDINRIDTLKCNADAVRFTWFAAGGAADDKLPVAPPCELPMGVAQIAPYE